MAKKKEAVEIVVIADRSGSMESLRDDAIGGFNSFLEEQQAVKGKANLTLVLFDDRYEIGQQGDLKQAVKLTRETFVPRGMTALNDALGRSLVELETKNPEKAIICVITDGAENASKEFTAEQVKEKVKAAEERGWQVVFLAANIDAFQAGDSLGISGSSTFSFGASAQGVQTAYATMSNSTRSYRSQ